MFDEAQSYGTTAPMTTMCNVISMYCAPQLNTTHACSAIRSRIATFLLGAVPARARRHSLNRRRFRLMHWPGTCSPCSCLLLEVVQFVRHNCPLSRRPPFQVFSHMNIRLQTGSGAGDRWSWTSHVKRPCKSPVDRLKTRPL